MSTLVLSLGTLGYVYTANLENSLSFVGIVLMMRLIVVEKLKKERTRRTFSKKYNSLELMSYQKVCNIYIDKNSNTLVNFTFILLTDVIGFKCDYFFIAVLIEHHIKFRHNNSEHN